SVPSFSLMFFASSADSESDEGYGLLLESSRFADRHGYEAVWVPERHFARWGCLYPNPSVLHAALARETRRVRLRAGSVVLPLHEPLRIAEEWAMVDRLSGGRVDLSFASGWNPTDFVLSPGSYAGRHEAVFAGIEEVRRLWRGERVKRVGVDGQEVEVRTYPTPTQPEVPVWVTAAGNPRTFERAGAVGANVLTHLLDQGVESMEEKIALYRASRARHGHDPSTGRVTMMLHTFVGSGLEEVHARVRGPFSAYLKSIAPQLGSLARSRGRELDVSRLSAGDLEEFVGFLYERFFSTRALLGTPESCRGLVSRLEGIGVDEVACLLDFGPRTSEILASLPHLNRLRELCRKSPARAAPPVRVQREGEVVTVLRGPAA
ncbi:MAG: LLM class flavin-dependent oxidoreductase, partial [Myxococcaceae bacterium]|nr:LLM class flavin-dependent oxidoreductase [Myxococcaceae bacterium]